MIKNKKGFSLIEMGVVVAIVALIFLVSLNAVQSMYTAYVTKSAKAALAIGKQEVLNFVAQHKKLPTTEQFDSMIRANIPMNQDSQPLTYQLKSTIADFLTPEQYCSYVYIYGEEETLGVTLEKASDTTNPFAFALGYQYKKETPMIERASYYELLDVLGCAERIRPSFVSTQLPPVNNEQVAAGMPYNATIFVKPRATESNVWACLEITSIPAGTAVNNKFQTNIADGTCGAAECAHIAGGCDDHGKYGLTDNGSITINMASALGGTTDGVRIKAFIQDASTWTYTIEKEYIIYKH